MKKISIGFFADGIWGEKSLIKILSDKNIIVKFICLRYKKPDKKIIKIAQKRNIYYFWSKNVNSSYSIKKISSFKCDLLVSMSFNQIFKKKLIELTKLSIINCHAGKLPFYRGRNILNWSLINDEKEFGITVHFVDRNLDTGDIILQKVYPITDKDDYGTLLRKCYKNCSLILYEGIKKIQFGNYKRIQQKKINSKGSYFKKRKKGDEIIKWNQSPRSLFNFVRAISKPGPMATTYYKNKPFFINKIHNIFIKCHKKKIKPGTIVRLDPRKRFIVVKTKNECVKILEWFGKLFPKENNIFYSKINKLAHNK